MPPRSLLGMLVTYSITYLGLLSLFPHQLMRPDMRRPKGFAVCFEPERTPMPAWLLALALTLYWRSAQVALGSTFPAGL